MKNKKHNYPKRAMPKTIYLFCLWMIIAVNYTYAQHQNKLDTVTAEEAANRIGEEVVIKSYVVTIFYAKNSTGKPTFLNLVKPFPDNPIAIILFENELKKLKINASDYLNKTILVRGWVRYYRDEEKPYKNKASITIYDKSQIKIIGKYRTKKM